jgi:hypothetical protein
MSCGVCSRMKTLSWGMGLETVAVGRWVSSRRPRGCEGACDSEAISEGVIRVPGRESGEVGDGMRVRARDDSSPTAHHGMQ